MIPGLSSRSGARRETPLANGGLVADMLWEKIEQTKDRANPGGWPLLVAINLGALVLDDRHGAQLALERCS
jgi:hypothetical protein